MAEWISITNIILTLAIVIFAYMQWQAVCMQNKQNLFNIRMDLYNKINQIIWDILFDFMNIKDNVKDNSKSASDINLRCLEITHNLLKIKHLFNNKVANIVEEFTKSAVLNSSDITKETDGTNLDFIDVFEKSDSVKQIFEEFFKNNNINYYGYFR